MTEENQLREAMKAAASPKYTYLEERKKEEQYPTNMFEQLVKDTFAEILRLSREKGEEYSGDVDRLANFRRNAKELEINMEVVWRIYAAKHWDAIGQYILDLNTGKTRKRTEPLSGRVDDLIVYLLLFKAMLDEREFT